MCESDVYIKRIDKEELVMEKAEQLIFTNGEVSLKGLGKGKKLSGIKRITINFEEHKVILE